MTQNHNFVKNCNFVFLRSGRGEILALFFVQDKLGLYFLLTISKDEIGLELSLLGLLRQEIDELDYGLAII